MQSTSSCDRHLMVGGDFYVRRVLQHMTTYAASMVLRHLGRRVPEARIRLRDHKVSQLLVTFYHYLAVSVGNFRKTGYFGGKLYLPIFSVNVVTLHSPIFRIQE